jgi:hypothetical protein
MFRDPVASHAFSLSPYREGFTKDAATVDRAQWLQAARSAASPECTWPSRADRPELLTGPSAAAAAGSDAVSLLLRIRDVSSPILGQDGRVPYLTEDSSAFHLYS